MLILHLKARSESTQNGKCFTGDASRFLQHRWCVFCWPFFTEPARASATCELARAFGRPLYGLDERHAEAAFFEFENAIDRAARWCRHLILQERRVRSGLEDHLCRTVCRLRGELRRNLARQPNIHAGLGK